MALPTALLTAALLVPWTGASAAMPQADGAVPPVAGALDPALAAVSGELSVARTEFEEALLLRQSGTELGQAALTDLAEQVLLEDLVRTQGVVIDDDRLAERFAELDAQARASGLEGGLRELLERDGLPLALFRERLRLQLALEALVRLDLGIPDDRPCPGEQQQLWLDAQLEQRGVIALPRPWVDDVAALVGGAIGIRAEEWAANIERQMPDTELRELAFQLLLARAVEARLPDLSEAGVQSAIDAEIDRRRADAEADPAFQGVEFERLLAAQGLTVQLLGEDPAVRIAALSTYFVDRAQGPEGLRAVYEAERDWFEDRYGEGVRTRILYLVAAPERGPLTPRTFADAEEVARGFAERIATEADFDRLARTQSEDPLSRDRGGDLGLVLPASDNVPTAVRDEVFANHGAGRSGLIGPLRLDNGVALLWLGAVRPSPPWEGMREHVHRELRRRFLVETLPPGSIRTAFDRQPDGSAPR